MLHSPELTHPKTDIPPFADRGSAKDDILIALRTEGPHLVVITDENSIAAVNSATFATRTHSRIIVRPTTTAEVSLVVRIANQRRVAVYPVSKGCNFGFGSRVPVQSVAILLDLSAMDKIQAYDREHGTLRVEPGVSFERAVAFLAAEGAKHYLNAIGGSPDASLIGNALERGDGAGPYCERSEHVCSFEVVLADGTIINTGFAKWPGSRLAGLSRHGVGPGVDELFVQSNLGIVTGMTFWLQRKPASFRVFQFQLYDTDGLAPTLEVFRDLLARNVVAGPIIFWNDYKLMASGTQMPWSLGEDIAPLRRDQVKALSNAYRAWIGHGGIYVDDPAIAAATDRAVHRALRAALGKAIYLASLSSRKIAWLRRLSQLPGRLFDFRRLISEWESSPLLGAVSRYSVRTQYWRKRQPPLEKPDPLADRCGVLSNCFDVPLEGQVIADLIARAEALMAEHGFEPILSLTLINHRYAKCFLQLMYDRDVPGEDQRAWACHAALFALIEQDGCTHVRVDIAHMQDMRERCGTTVLRDRIAAALDPHATIAPGRYEF
jgi:4-cresol dehydrogenase (hydroxylating)